MKVIISFIAYTYCCDNHCKSIILALEKPGKLGDFFSYFVATLLEFLPLDCHRYGVLLVVFSKFVSVLYGLGDLGLLCSWWIL